MNKNDIAFLLVLLIIIGGCVGDNAIKANERIQTLRIEKGLP